MSLDECKKILKRETPFENICIKWNSNTMTITKNSYKSYDMSIWNVMSAYGISSEFILERVNEIDSGSAIVTII